MKGAWGYRSYREHLADRFPGRRIRKLCLQAGFTCPNLDGTVARGGCAWCDNHGFAPGLGQPDLLAQWDRGRAALRRRHRRVDGFIAYLQAFTNTHAPVDRLSALWSRFPGEFPECVGLSIGTRPDCLPGAVLDLLEATARRLFTTVEIGLQSDRDAVLAAMNRGHDAACFADAVRRAAGRGFELCAHVILGLPGEGEDAPERLGDLLAGLPIDSVKVHNLHVMRGTALARRKAAGLLHEPTRAAYRDLAARLIVRLRPDQAVQRLIADAPDRILLSDPWCHDKQGFLNDLAPLVRSSGRPVVRSSACAAVVCC
jgi:radical SAM protein (TIGR01212 family)